MGICKPKTLNPGWFEKTRNKAGIGRYNNPKTLEKHKGEFMFTNDTLNKTRLLVAEDRARFKKFIENQNKKRLNKSIKKKLYSSK